MLIGGIAPTILVGLALLRGRRIGNPYLAVFPVLGLFVTLLGAFPYMMTNMGGETVIMGATVITWIF